MFPVSPEKEKSLYLKMSSLGVTPDSFVETFIRASGPGGQKVNKTSSCVVLKHNPTGIEVRCQISRSQAMNRFLARRLLCEKIEAQALGRQSTEKRRIEKIRRQKRKRSKRAKEKMLEQKKKVSEKKTLRRRPDLD